MQVLGDCATQLQKLPTAIHQADTERLRPIWDRQAPRLRALLRDIRGRRLTNRFVHPCRWSVRACHDRAVRYERQIRGTSNQLSRLFHLHSHRASARDLECKYKKCRCHLQEFLRQFHQVDHENLARNLCRDHRCHRHSNLQPCEFDLQRRCNSPSHLCACLCIFRNTQGDPRRFARSDLPSTRMDLIGCLQPRVLVARSQQ